MSNTKFEWTRINNDVNGNPRYVCHFLNLLTEAEREKVSYPHNYPLAVKRANKIGGKKFHNKQYGGGIVFQCYGGEEMEPFIEQAKNEALAVI
jgi:hypothetical protein